ncbi:GDP-mannose 4,6-dehydratase [archaeon]|nr:GDP-mannose 4,6-dehydratase [archaeon]
MDNILITGGAGFIGSNLANVLIKNKKNVTILDNFSRQGSRQNAAWLRSINSDINIVHADVRNFSDVKNAASGKDAIFHTAGQVAVTSSIMDPREDFEINALGTFNVLEAARKNDSTVIYCSTNKVYGSNVNDVSIEELPKRYEFSGDHRNGITEDFHIDAHHHTPYGVSKLVGEDVLFASDLIDLFIKEAESEKKIHGHVFNVGGGKKNTLSLIELMEQLKKISGIKISYTKDDWRAADQKVYYSDVSKAMSVFGWEPKVSPEEGIKALFDWTSENRSLFI